MSIKVKRPAGTVPIERRWPKQLKAWMAARRSPPSISGGRRQPKRR